MPLEAKIEAVLFWKGEPVNIKELAKFLGIEKETVESEIKGLQNSLEGRGLTIVQNGEEVMLYTAPETSELIKKLAHEEMVREISKAGVEVLSLVIYRGPIAKRDIDYVRGVNSSYIIRNLMVRGLIERLDSRDAGSFVYQPTFELLAHLGVSRKEDLPDFAAVQKDIETFMLNPDHEKENNG
ncbi:MAG: SMC-Scp complex subunit ScpB [Patescibacteria group bacterium]